MILSQLGICTVFVIFTADSLRDVCIILYTVIHKLVNIITIHSLFRPRKITLFRAYYQAFYTDHLWYKYVTEWAFDRLSVQHYNVFHAMRSLLWRYSAFGTFALNRVDDYCEDSKRIGDLWGSWSNDSHQYIMCHFKCSYYVII